jgi:hypothetical protein
MVKGDAWRVGLLQCIVNSQGMETEVFQNGSATFGSSPTKLTHSRPRRLRISFGNSHGDMRFYADWLRGCVVVCTNHFIPTEGPLKFSRNF